MAQERKRKHESWSLKPDLSVFDQKQLHKCSHNQVWDLLTNIKAQGPQGARFFNPETTEYRRDFLSFQV